MKYRGRKPTESPEDYAVWLENFRRVDNARRLRLRQKARASIIEGRANLTEKLHEHAEGIKQPVTVDIMSELQLIDSMNGNLLIGAVILLHGVPYYLRYNDKGAPGLCTSLLQTNWRHCISKHAKASMHDMSYTSQFNSSNEGFLYRVSLLRKRALSELKVEASEETDEITEAN